MAEYDGFAKEYDSDARMTHPLRRLVYEKWINECGKINDDYGITWAVDFGCGAGISSRMLRDHGADFVQGVDISEKMLKIARSKEKKSLRAVDYIRQDIFERFALDIPFRLATAVLAIHYASSKKRLENFVLNVGNSLRCGGKFVAVTLDPDNPVAPYRKGAMSAQRWTGKPFEEGSIIEATAYDLSGKPLCPPFINYYWRKETYDFLFRKNGFVNVRWVKDGVLAETSLIILKAEKEDPCESHSGVSFWSLLS